MSDRQAIISTKAHFDHVADDDIEWIIKYYEAAKIANSNKIVAKQMEKNAARYCHLRDYHYCTINNMGFGCEFKNVELILAPLYAHLSRPAVDRSALDDIVDFQITLRTNDET